MSHKALWVNADMTQEVKTVEGNYTPQEDEILLKCICVGVNPADWKHSEIFGAINTIEGLDAVGDIVQLGPGVTDFKIGQVVLTITRGIGAPCYGANQEYFLAGAKTTWAFDETKLSKEQAATIPLTLCVACDGLFLKMDPPLALPWEERKSNWPILLWGGATQVGIQAIQLARLAGCSPIIVTASKKHEEYLKSLGADFVLDYKDPSIEARIRACIPSGKALRHAFDCAGAYPESFKSLVEPGGSIVLVLADRGNYPNHRVERAIGGYIHMLGAFDAATFSYKPGTERERKAGRIARELMAWTMNELRKDVSERKYQPPRVRRLSGKGMHDVLEAFRLMKGNEISGEKVVYWMEETPEVKVTRK